jgi:hypothetical protein
MSRDLSQKGRPKKRTFWCLWYSRPHSLTQEMSLEVKEPRRTLLDGIARSVYAVISWKTIGNDYIKESKYHAAIEVRRIYGTSC